MGMALNLEEIMQEQLYWRLLFDKEGDEVRATGRVVSVPAGESLLGRVVNALGEPIDGKGEIKAEKYMEIEKSIRYYLQKPVFEPLQTGIKSIDGMVPIGSDKEDENL